MRLSDAEFAAVVSNAGALGILISAGFASGEELRAEIRKAKSLTDKPFGVNISLFPSRRPIPNDEFIDVIIDEGVAVVESSGTRSPEQFVDRLHKGNVKLIHKVAGARYAKTAERVGADAVAVVGYENGGALGMYDVGTMVMIPKTVDLVKIPVIGGGGIADARGFLAALALGAEGVVMGTRFMATQECRAHPKFKEWLLRAEETETIPIMRSFRNTHRALRNKASEKVAEMESRGVPIEELFTILGGERGAKVMLEGDLEAGTAGGGQCVGLINDIPTVKEVIDNIINGATAIRERLGRLS